ncbi:hypothetical protein K8B83_01170 [Shewanella inventionis]|uniref:Uncharacterized protein n=1 Tax=Shewanella inventionis TaxID=1738770 RepID=A0ABQ1J3W6_9GAMM|nr:hypothetical protein [Shewanella inventionis]UAL43538.1 hypothetical protein K8B83_01170 [Shewanella inventionis]GGB58087.1 hypothetical protein GCM10011607_18370 [Shewanella inventionis]
MLIYSKHTANFCSFLYQFMHINLVIPLIKKVFNPVTYLLLGLSLLSINSHATEPQDHSQHAKHPVKMGLHGMLLFGSQYGLFASHLPMFHQPHNAQVVFKLSFADPKIQAEVINGINVSAKSDDPVWTIVPTTFDLSRLDPKHSNHTSQLTVDVVKGHFERGGEMQWQAQTINVDKIVLFNPLPLESGLNKSANNDYHTLNYHPDDKVQFIVNTLSVRPDADHIVRIDNVQTPLPSQLTLAADKRLFISEKQLSSALSGKENVTRIYLELGELK